MGLLDSDRPSLLGPSFGEYLRRSGRNLAEAPQGLLDWLAGGARMGAEPTLALMRGDALGEPLLPTATSGGRLGAIASAVTQQMIPGGAPAGALSANLVGHGPFGPVYEAATSWRDAVDTLKAAQHGEVRGALFHPDVGPIDLVWGHPGTGASDGHGLSKLLQFHPDVVDDLPDLLSGMAVTQRGPNRVRMASPDGKATVRLDWDGAAKTWLLTAYKTADKGPAP